MSHNDRNLDIGFEEHARAHATSRNYLNSMPAISRRAFLLGGTAVAASLLLREIVEGESSGGSLKEYDIATNGISLHVTEQ